MTTSAGIATDPSSNDVRHGTNHVEAPERDSRFSLPGAADLLEEIDAAHGVWLRGRGTRGSSGRCLDVEDPSSGQLIATVPDANNKDATAAVDAAASALRPWATTTSRGRSEVLRRAFDLMLADAERLAQLVSWENGKALSDARAEITYAAEFLRWFSEEAVRSDGNYGPAPTGNARSVVTHSPVGVCALVTPWNFPAAMATRKIGPALAAGCTVVLKPAAETPLTALAIAQILTRAGVPDGVVNLVPTSNPGEVVGRLLHDPRVRKLSFTGSTSVGRLLLAQSATRVLRTSMELGGNAPFVVTETADLDLAVDAAMVAKFRNGGQACTAANRLYIHDAVYDPFQARFGEAVASLRVGPAAQPSTQIGPLISARAVSGLSRLVEDALVEGARISHQAPSPGVGYFYPPTLLSDVPADAAILSQEIFGPVAPLVRWDDERDLLARLNDTEYGLAAYVISGDVGRAMMLAEQIDAGMVAVNRGVVSDPAAPFGGVKQSGLGREGARDGLREYQDTRYISVAWS